VVSKSEVLVGREKYLLTKFLLRMKSKILLLTLFAALSTSLYAQPNDWRESSPVDFDPLTYATDFVNKTEGIASLKITFTETGTPYYVSDTFNVTASTAFTFTIDVLDNDPGAEVNQRIVFLDAANAGTNSTSTVYSANNASFQTLTYSGTAPATAVKAYVVIRMYDVAASWTGSGTFNLDNASFTQGGSNLIPNPGFESWKEPVEGSTIIDWRESSPVDFDPLTIIHDAANKTNGFYSAKITFTETGTPYFVSDTFNVTASTAFSFTIDVLDNDAAAEVNQRVVFLDAANAGTNSTSSIYSTTNASFQTLTYTGTSPANAVKAYVVIRIYDVAASWAGSGTFNLDNASFTQGGANLIPNPSFEEWLAPTNKPEFLTYTLEGLTPAVVGTIDKGAHTVALAVPFATNVTALVGTYTLSDGATAKVGATDQVSGTTPNNFSSPVVYTLTGADATTQDWTVTVTKNPASTAKNIVSFVFEALTPDVFGVINAAQDTITLSVPTGTNVTALVPTIAVSEFATVAPASGVAQDFTNPVVYTVTAQDASTKTYKVVVKLTSEVTLFQEYFENVPRVIPAGFKLIDNDHYTHDPGDARWIDSAWVVSTSSRPEWTGNHMAICASIYTDMPLTGKADDWMILPAITVGANSTLSWKAMSLTNSGNYPDDYRVIAAPSHATLPATVSYFETYGQILQTVAPESWSAAVGNPGQGLKTRSINLKDKGYTNQSIWIAFVLTTDLYTNPTTGVPNTNAGGSALAIDEIKVVEGAPSTGINDPKKESLHVNVYPNPTHGIFNVAVYSESNSTAIIEVVDLVGRVVYTKTAEVGIGKNTIELNASELNNGLYLIQTKINNKVNVSKLMVK
jgi:hypothetical protein